MPDCYAIVSGSYSNYQVHVVFENEEDAKAYALQMGRAGLKRTHESIVAGRQKYLVTAGSGPANPHQGEFETCPLCVKLLADRSYYGADPYKVERFDYWPEGTLPASDPEGGVAPRQERTAPGGASGSNRVSDPFWRPFCLEPRA